LSLEVRLIKGWTMVEKKTKRIDRGKEVARPLLGSFERMRGGCKLGTAGESPPQPTTILDEGLAMPPAGIHVVTLCRRRMAITNDGKTYTSTRKKNTGLHIAD